MVYHQKSLDKNVIMLTTEKPLDKLVGFSQYSFLANPSKINPVYYFFLT